MARRRASRFGVLVASALTTVALVAGVAPAALASGPPATPTGVALVGGNRSMAVSWTDSSSGRIIFTATAQSPGRATRSCVSKRTSCKLASLQNGVVYEVTVVARDRAGSSAPSAAASGRAGVPGAPRNVKVAADAATLSVSWMAPAASNVARITGYMATASPGGFSCSTAGTIISQPGRACEIAGLTPGTTYAVTVTATNAWGTGAPSAAVSGTAS
jgi:large repetitive protein